MRTEEILLDTPEDRILADMLQARERLVTEIKSDPTRFKAVLVLVKAGWNARQISYALMGEKIGAGQMERWVREARRVVGKTIEVHRDRLHSVSACG